MIEQAKKPTINIQQALENTAKVLADYKGNLGEHAALQEGFKLIVEMCQPPKDKVESKDDN